VTLLGPWLVLATFLAIGAAIAGWLQGPRRVSWSWAITGLPLLVAPAAVATRGPAPHEALGALAGALALAALALLAWTIRAHPRPPSMWHQPADLPPRLVTWGPYRFVRHPLYGAYLLALAAAVPAAPGAVAAGALGAGAWLLHRTAVGEEARLLTSPNGAAYAAYRDRTGRFWPRFWAARSAWA
jgi:protein-S-isoprenylcysteine O-methyltransferase Ste14